MARKREDFHAFGTGDGSSDSRHLAVTAARAAATVDFGRGVGIFSLSVNMFCAPILGLSQVGATAAAR